MAQSAIKPVDRPLRVAFVFGQSSSAGRAVIAGAYEYLDRHVSWEVIHIESGPRAVFDLESLAYLDGFIASGHREYERLSQCGEPTWQRVFFSTEPERRENVVT